MFRGAYSVTLAESIHLVKVIQPGDILVVNTDNSIISIMIQKYEHSLDRDKFFIYANHVVQVYDKRLCLDQMFPISKFDNFVKYLNKNHQIAIIRPNFTTQELEKCQSLMLKANGTVYNILQIIGFCFCWASIKIFRYQIENYFDIKKADICSSAILRRLIVVDKRFNIVENEFHKDEGLVTPQDFLRAVNLNNNFKFIYGTGKFLNIGGQRVRGRVN